MASKSNDRIQFKVGFDVDKSSLSQITKSLQDVQKAASSNKDSGLTKQFNEAAAAAKELEQIVNQSWNNKLNQLNLNKFNQSIQQSFGSVQNLKNQLAQGGAQGQAAFNSLASSVLNTNIQLKQSNKLLDSMATSMANTVKWGITASIFNNITGSIQRAFYYAKDLNSSLTDIRMVTGAGADQMQRFAQNANNISKNLGRSTLDFTKSAVEYYRQGLSDEEVQERSEITLKAQNITGAGNEMVDYLTSVWNGFKATREQAEGFVDSMALVADTSASDLSELATAMSKTAATANVVGVEFNQLNAMIATVVATTRLAPEAVGTAFKTIFARINDIKTGAEDAEISLGNYSGRMAELGVNVLDANGRLRDTGDVLTEVGQKWSTLTKEQQTYLASTIGGQRQITQVMALFDNWDQYVQLLNTSLSANGTLNEKNNIYLESTAAHLQQLGAQAQRTYDILIDTDAINGLVDTLNGALSIFNDFIQGIGGGANAFAYFGSFVAGIFSKQISQSIIQAENNFKNFLNTKNIEKYKEQFAAQTLYNETGVDYYNTEQTTPQQDAIIARARAEAEVYAQTLSIRKGLTKEQQVELDNAQKHIGQLNQQLSLLRNKDALLQQAGLFEGATSEHVEDEIAQQQQRATAISNSITALKEFGQFQRDINNDVSDIEVAWTNLQGSLQKNNILTKEFKNLIEGGVPSQQRLVQILKQASGLYSDQNTQVEKLKQLKELVLAAENKDQEKIKQILGLEERRVKNLENTGKHALNIQKAIKGMSAAGQVFTAAAGALPTLMDKTATGAEKANAAFSGVQGTISAIGTMFGPIGMGVSTLINGALSLIKSVFPGIERLFMSAEEKLAEFKNTVKEVNEEVSSRNKTISSLEQIQEEYARLSQAAGEYGRNVDKMTEEDKARYHELTNEFASYNDSVILGYDAQGNAIVKNQEALQQTIQLLREQRKQAVRSTLGNSNTAVQQANETLMTSQQASEEALQNNISFSEYSTIGLVKQQLQGIQDALNNEIQNFSNWYDGSIDELLGTIVNGTDKTVEEILNAFDWENFNYGDQQGISGLYNALFNMLKGQGGANIDQANTILNLLQEYDEFYGEFGSKIQDIESKISAAQALADQDVYFDTGFISDILQFGQGYDTQFENLRKSGFLNSDIETLILDYIDGFKYNADLVNKAVSEIDFSQKEAGTYDQIIQAGQNFITFLTSAIKDSNDAIKEAFEKADIQNADDLQGTITERIAKATEIINDVLSNLQNTSQYQSDDSKREALAAYIAQALGIDTLVLKPGENGIEIDTVDIVPDQVLTDAKAAIEQKFADQKIFVTTEVTFKAKQGPGTYEEITKEVTRNYQITIEKLQQIFEQGDLANIGQILSSIWGGVEERITNGQSNYDKAIEDTYNEYKQLEEELNDLTNIDFDSAFDDFDTIVDNLKNTKQLKDEQKEYLSLLESQDSKLKQLATTEGRGSQAYIDYLTQRKSLGQQIYLQEQQSIIENSTRQLQLLDDTEENAGKRLELEQTIAEALYNQARATESLKDAEKERAEAAQKRQLAQAQTQLTAAQNMRAAASKISNQINFGQSQTLTSEDLTALNYLNSLDSELAQIAQEQGIYSQEYLDKLYQAIAAHGDLNTIAQESMKAVYEAQKVQAQGELKKAQDQQRRLINQRVESQLGDKNALNVSDPQLISKMQAEAAQWLAANDERYQNAQAEVDKYTAEITEADLAMLQLQADTAAALQQASKHQISIDVMVNKNDLFDALANTQQLSDAQLEYVLALEASDDGLAKIASTSGRYSKQYQQALRKIAAEDMKLYKQQIEEQKKRQQAIIEANQANLNSENQAERTAAEIAIQNAKNEIIRLDGQILIAEQAITKEIENQRQASLKLQQEQTQNSIANVKNLSTAIEHLKNSSQDITTSDYTAIYDWLNGHPELAELAGENYANIFDSSFISALERSYKNDKENILSGYFSDAVKQAEEAVAEASQKVQTLEAKISGAQATLAVPEHLRDESGISNEDVVAAEQTLAAAEQERLQTSQELKQANIALLEAKSQENEQNRIALATEQERLNIFNQLTNREDLNPDEQLRLNTLMDDLIMKYPQLTQAANILKDTWMVGTQEYAAALKQVEDQLEALNYEELQNQLEDISINITLENLDDCIDQIEDFLDVDREIIIAIHTDAENEFDRLQDQMERIYDASSKIGQNFIVAADDIRELNNVFPGILNNMHDLHDGTVQLSQDAVQQAIAGASQVVAADAQSVNQQLQSQANLLHAKAANYRAAAQAAARLAQAQVNSEEGSAADRATVFAALQTARVDMGAQATQAETENLSNVVTASDQAGSSMSSNVNSAASSMANSVYQFALNAIENFHAVAQASQGAAEGNVQGSAIPPGAVWSSYSGGVNTVSVTANRNNISNNYSGGGRGGYSDDYGTIGADGIYRPYTKEQQLQNLKGDSTWQDLSDLFNQLANDAESAANDIEGMIAETALDLSKLGKELSDAGSGRPKSGKGSGGGGGGGGSGKEPDIMDLLEDQYDKYHDINLELTRLANNFEKLAEEQEKLYGKQLIDNLNAQLQNLEDQISAYKFKIKLARIQQVEMQAALRQQGALFDKNGYLSNYNQLMFDKINKVNATIAYYNTLSAAEQETYKDVVEAAKEEYEKFKQQIESYDTLISETIPELEKSIREKIDEQMQIRINHFKLHVETQLDLSKAERQWNKFRKKVINSIKKDDILGNLDASFKDLASYFESGTGTGQIGALTDQVNKTLDQLHQMDETGTSDVYGNNRAQAMQDLQKYRTKLMQSLQDVEDIMDEIEQSIFDAIDETADALDNQAGLYEHISDIINHDVKVVELIYGDKAYDTLSKYYDMQHSNDLMHLDFLRQQKELWYQRMQIEQQRMSELDMQSNEWKSAQKRFNEYKEKWMQTTKELNSTVEDSIQNIIDKYTNTINKIFDQLEKKWTSGKGMSYLEEEWELINKQADLYLDKVNSMYEIQKLEKAYKDAINDAANDTKAQQSLNNLMQEQLKFLRDKDKLTQYDVDRANLLLQIEIKRLALEQSRNNKTKLRLRRDRQGNYSYQYTSDDDQVASARQELNDLMNELYNLTHNAYTENLDTLYKTVAEYEEKIKEVYEDTTLSAEEQQKKLAMYNEYYGNIINGLTQQNEELKQYMFEDTFNSLFYMYQNNLSEYESMTDEQKALMKDAFDYFYTTYGENLKNFNNMTQEERALAAYTFAEMARMYGLNVLDYRNMTAEQEALAADLFRTLDLAYTDNTAAFGRMTGDNVDKFQYLSDTEKQILTSQIVPHWNSSIQEMADTFAGSDGFISTCEEALKDLKQATSTYETDLKSIAEAAGKDFDLIKQGIDADITSTEGLIEDNKTLIEKLKEFINLVDKQAVQALADLRKNYNMAKTAAINATEAAYKYTQQLGELKSAIEALPLKKTIQIEYQQNTPTVTPYTPPAVSYTPSYSPSGSGGTGGNGGYGGYGGGNTGSSKKVVKAVQQQTKGVFIVTWSDGSRTNEYKNYTQSQAKKRIGQTTFKTGGYTGDWSGQDGKLAVLHQKELILNETDTKNILSAVNVVRALSDLLAGVGSEVSASRYANTIGAAAAQSLDQNVHITATFPNVTEHTEIEKALNSLVNRASQFAFRK